MMAVYISALLNNIQVKSHQDSPPRNELDHSMTSPLLRYNTKKVVSFYNSPEDTCSNIRRYDDVVVVYIRWVDV